jgi:hypothetical protein
MCVAVVCLSNCLWFFSPTSVHNYFAFNDDVEIVFSIKIYFRFTVGARITQWYSSGLRTGWSGVRVPTGTGNFSLHHRVQTGSVSHPASYPMGTEALSLGVKRPGREAGHSPPYSAEVKECVELYLHFPNSFSWGGAQLKQHRDNFTFTFHKGKRWSSFCA